MTDPAVRRPASAMRTFDPVRLGLHEADAWVTYYRRQWAKFLGAAVGMVRVGFGLPLPASVRGAWYVLRANQAWAPFPDNDPAGAQAYMRRFYALVKRHHAEPFDMDTAARLEIAWWRAHRELQHADRYPDATEDGLTDAIADLYAHTFGVPVADVREAAALRAKAMGISDKWVAEGRDPKDPALKAERHALVNGYAALRKAIDPV